MAEYKPKFPEMHKFLLEVYQNLMMQEDPDEISKWAERFKSLHMTLEAMKTGTVLPPLFTSHFWEDARDVSCRVNAMVGERKLTEKQKLLMLGMANLQTAFGAP